MLEIKNHQSENMKQNIRKKKKRSITINIDFESFVDNDIHEICILFLYKDN